jgi:hypothetical protein
VAVASSVAVLGVIANGFALRDSARGIRAASDEALGRYSAFELERSRIDPAFTPNVFLPTAGNYFAAADAYGRVGLGPDALDEASESVREAADRTLKSALGLRLTRASRARAEPSASAPQVSAGADVASRPSAGCLELSSPDEAQAAITVPPGGRLAIGAPAGAGTTAYVRRFADAVDAALPWPQGARAALLKTPRDRAPAPWTVVINVPDSLRVCVAG